MSVSGKTQVQWMKMAFQRAKLASYHWNECFSSQWVSSTIEGIVRCGGAVEDALYRINIYKENEKKQK